MAAASCHSHGLPLCQAALATGAAPGGAAETVTAGADTAARQCGGVKVADMTYITADTKATIDKKEVTLPAGMTYQAAYDYSTNGGWRNRVRMAIAKAAKLV